MRRAWSRLVLAHDRIDNWMNDRIVGVFTTMGSLTALVAVSLATWSLITRSTLTDRIVAVVMLVLMLVMSAILIGAAFAEYADNEARATHARVMRRVKRQHDDDIARIERTLAGAQFDIVSRDADILERHADYCGMLNEMTPDIADPFVAAMLTDADIEHDALVDMIRHRLAERSSLANLIVTLALDDENHDDMLTDLRRIAHDHALVVWYADAFHNGEGVGLDDMARAEQMGLVTP